MTVSYLGSLSIGGVLPGAVGVAVAGQAGINAALPDLQGQLDGLLSFSPTPIDLTAQIATAQAIIAGIQASITLGVAPPSLEVQLAGIQALVATLQATLGTMNAQLAVITSFQSALSAAGVHLYRYTGQTADLGPELTTELSGGAPGGSPTDEANALVVLTTDSATWAALSEIFEV